MNICWCGSMNEIETEVIRNGINKHATDKTLRYSWVTRLLSEKEDLKMRKDSYEIAELLLKHSWFYELTLV